MDFKDISQEELKEKLYSYFEKHQGNFIDFVEPITFKYIGEESYIDSSTKQKHDVFIFTTEIKCETEDTIWCEEKEEYIGVPGWYTEIQYMMYDKDNLEVELNDYGDITGHSQPEDFD